MNDMVTISDGDSITFVERVSWSHNGDTETELELLRHYMIVGYIVTVCGFYLVLRNMDPEYFNISDREYKLARCTVNDETDKVEIHSLNISAAQLGQLRRAGDWFDYPGDGNK